MYILRVIKELFAIFISTIYYFLVVLLGNITFFSVKKSIFRVVKGVYTDFFKRNKDKKAELVDMDNINDVGVKNLLNHYTKRLSKNKLKFYKYEHNEYYITTSNDEIVFFGYFKDNFEETLIRDLKHKKFIEIVYAVVNGKQDRLKRITREDVDSFFESMDTFAQEETEETEETKN